MRLNGFLAVFTIVVKKVVASRDDFQLSSPSLSVILSGTAWAIQVGAVSLMVVP